MASDMGKPITSLKVDGGAVQNNLLMEIQALVASSIGTTPRRNVVGWDQGRLSMIAAVLEARADINLARILSHLNTLD